MNFKEFMQSEKYASLVRLLAILLVALIIFAAGMFAGYHEAIFSYEWQSGYMRGFGDPNSPFAPLVRDNDEVNPHGVFGNVVSVNAPYFMVKGPNQAESVVQINGDTMIRRMHTVATTSDLIPGSRVTVIGSPDGQGRIQAVFVRIVPDVATGTSQ